MFAMCIWWSAQPICTMQKKNTFKLIFYVQNLSVNTWSLMAVQSLIETMIFMADDEFGLRATSVVFSR